MKPELTKVEDYFAESAMPSLRSYFGRVREGQPKEYRTPFAAGTSVQGVLTQWEDTLAKIEHEWPSLYNFENDMRSKVGPMSIMKPLSQRMDDIEQYYTCVTGDADAVSEAAIQATLAEFKIISGIRLRSQDQTLQNMKLSTNSGSPYFTKRKYALRSTRPCEIEIWDDSTLWQYLRTGSHEEEMRSCAILGWRGQEGGPTKDDVKQRVVWMFPFAVNIRELQVYQPLIDACQRTGLVPSWVSMDQVDKSITYLFDTKDDDQLVVCTDFSKFDQHFNSSLQHAAYTILSQLLTDNDDSEYWLREVYWAKYMIPLMYDIGRFKFGLHGMASGSGGTNADETLAHRALQHEAALSANSKLNPYSQCLGDDGIISYPGCTVDAILQSYTRHGLEMNQDKQYASTDDLVYLRRWHHKDYRQDGICVGVYSTYRALGRLMEQERYYSPEFWSREMVAMRQLSIIENVKYHPLREEFAKFCMERDKYRLGIDIPGFLDSIEVHAAKAMENIPDFLGFTKTMESEGMLDAGIGSWWIVKYLRSMK